MRPAKELIVFVLCPRTAIPTPFHTGGSSFKGEAVRFEEARSADAEYISLQSSFACEAEQPFLVHAPRPGYGTYRSVGTIIPTPTGMSEYYDETVFSAVISDVLAFLAGPRGLSRSRTVGSGEGRGEGATPVSAPRVLRPHSCSHIALYSSRRLARHRRRMGGCG